MDHKNFRPRKFGGSYKDPGIQDMFWDHPWILGGPPQ